MIKSGSSPKRFYVFDGEQLIGEVGGSTPAPTNAYTWGADGLVSERILGSSPESLYYQYGPQGETRYLTNASGGIANSYYYNAYGRVLTGTGTKYNRYLYGGKFGYYSDGGMGLMLAGQRWYSSFVMKWLSRDPIEYGGGDNLYEYLKGRPTGYVDPSRLDWLDYLSNASGGFGDGIVSGITLGFVDGLGINDNIDRDSDAYKGGEAAGEILGEALLGAGTLRCAAELSRFKAFRWLNSKPYLRIGRGRMSANGGLGHNPKAPRISFGPNRNGNGPRRLHIDLRIRPIDR